jgi:hypothetical protein
VAAEEAGFLFGGHTKDPVIGDFERIAIVVNLVSDLFQGVVWFKREDILCADKTGGKDK